MVCETSEFEKLKNAVCNVFIYNFNEEQYLLAN